MKIVPKVITLASLTNTSTVDPLIGALVQINNAEFESIYFVTFMRQMELP